MIHKFPREFRKINVTCNYTFVYKKHFYKKMSLKNPKPYENFKPDLQFLKTLIFPRTL